MILILGPLIMLRIFNHNVERKYVWVTVLIMSFQAIIAYPINVYIEKITGEKTNMMFVMEPPAEVLSIFPKHPYYIFTVAILFIVFWNVIYYKVKKKHQ